MRSLKGEKNIASFLLTFVIFFVLWAALSTFFDVVHLSLGAICSLLVAYASHDLLIKPKGAEHVLTVLETSFRFFLYLFWLITQIIRANIDVMMIVLSPKLPISPEIIKFDSKLPNDVALTTLANSITLTPGTLTVDIDEKKTYYVHCLAKRHGDALLKGKMQSLVARVFGGKE
ncbi:MAG: Na+/H+ antiporter subunit E [Methanocellales archaeon]|nr:Na+/H+ antiporter subunit E [Methanocellales archaeon]